MMVEFPKYDEVFKDTQRRLRSLSKTLKKQNKMGNFNDFMFLIVGNINLRLNTMFFLMSNGNSDGVIPLQRTIFELQLALKAFVDANDKSKYLELYLQKRTFESANEWDKLVTNKDSNLNQLISDSNKEYINNTKKDSVKAIESSTKEKVYKVWYELASGCTVKELSAKYSTPEDYLQSYDEPSNWVHPQRLEGNLDTEFNQHLNETFFIQIIHILRRDLDWLSEDIEYIAKLAKIVESKALISYGEKLKVLDEHLLQLVREG